MLDVQLYLFNLLLQKEFARKSKNSSNQNFLSTLIDPFV